MNHLLLLTYLLIFHLKLRQSCVAAIEDDYVGPKLEDGKVTLMFMKEMMDWFKDQKKLHRKCAYQVKLSAHIKILYTQRGETYPHV